MFELNKIRPQSYYINSPAKIGLYVKDNKDVYLIDSGNDKDAGRKINRIINENGWNLRGILNTHSNADHIGGNAFLQNKTDCLIFSKGIERTITMNPIIEPSFLYGGYPFKELRNKFLMAQKSICLDIDHPDFPKEVEVIDIPGHFFDMVAFKLPDKTVFLADCVFSRLILDKYRIPFIYDVEKYLETLEKIKNIDANIFIPAHAEPCEDISELADYNREMIFKIAETIKSILKKPQTFEELLKSVFDIYELKMDVNQYVLVGSTVRSFLSWLKDRGEISLEIKDNRILWMSQIS